MASFGQTFDASSVEPSSGYEVLPPGKYLAQIVASEMRATKDGMGQYLYLEVDVIEGQYAGRKLFDRLNLINAMQMLCKSHSARCHLSAVPLASCRSAIRSSCTSFH